MDTKISFLYLSEPDTIAAGVNDAENCIKTSEDVFKLLAQGDYLMGGSNHNSHGMGIVFPKETKFPNMPVAGPDRRFVAMPAYLGGRFDVCGNKWYGSNAVNKDKGLLCSVLTVMLNDKDTGAPLCLMSANLLSAARTGSVPGVAAKHLARKDSEVASIIGCGPINTACFRNIITQCKGIKKVFCFDIFEEKSQQTAQWIGEEFCIEGVATDNLEKAINASDVVTVAASRLKPLHIDSSWLKAGATVLLTGPANGDEALWTDSRIVFDHIGLHQCYVSEAIETGDKNKYYSGVIGGPIYSLIDEGKLPSLEDSTSIGQIILNEKAGRQSEEETIVFVSCGMAVFDVGWGYDVYKKAQELGIGQELTLWDTPAL